MVSQREYDGNNVFVPATTPYLSMVNQVFQKANEEFDRLMALKPSFSYNITVSLSPSSSSTSSSSSDMIIAVGDGNDGCDGICTNNYGGALPQSVKPSPSAMKKDNNTNITDNNIVYDIDDDDD